MHSPGKENKLNFRYRGYKKNKKRLLFFNRLLKINQ